MKITITLDCKKYDKNEFDITVNDEQTIEDCLRIVNEGLRLNLDLNAINYCRSKREKKLITVYGTFQENNIYTGDILELL
ncbi:MAG TPA: hypothetical protein DG753_12080 [Clostridium sp.]|nr:hypothetical protein [Clostridium sp.]